MFIVNEIFENIFLLSLKTLSYKNQFKIHVIKTDEKISWIIDTILYVIFNLYHILFYMVLLSSSLDVREAKRRERGRKIDLFKLLHLPLWLLCSQSEPTPVREHLTAQSESVTQSHEW